MENTDTLRLVRAELVRIAEDLESGRIKWANPNKSRPLRRRQGFNMSYFHVRCNTVHCIGGWLDVRLEKLGLRHADLTGLDPRLDRLFYPNICGGVVVKQYEHIRPDAAAKAIRRYLEGRKNPWTQELAS